MIEGSVPVEIQFFIENGNASIFSSDQFRDSRSSQFADFPLLFNGVANRMQKNVAKMGYEIGGIHTGNFEFLFRDN